MKKRSKNRWRKNNIQQGHQIPRLSGLKLSLCMIVKNEASNLGPCIHSVRSVIDEVIVVDTGSTDETKAIARQLGAKVFDFPWADDFGAARNESIRQATGDYILWLDADDRLDPSEIIKLRNLKRRLLDPQKDKAYYFVINSQSTVDGQTLFLQLRIFPNIPGAVFEGKVHEQIFQVLSEMGIQFVKTDIVIRHTGYLDSLTNVRKSERNLAILLKELEAEPDNLIVHYYAARTLSGLGRNGEAIVHIERIKKDETIKKKNRQFFFAAALLLGKYYSDVGRDDDAVSTYQDLSREFEDSGLIHYCLGQALFLTGDYRGSREELEKSLRLPIEVSLFPANLDGLHYYQYYTLGESYLRTGEPGLGEKMLLKSLDFPADHQKSLEALALLSLQDQQFEEARGYYRKAIQEGKASDQIYSNLGLAYRKLNLLAEAEEALLKALEINPQRVEALTNLGQLYYQKREYQKAVECFTRALGLSPHVIDVRLSLSKIHFRLLELDKLVEQCDALLAELNLSLDLIVNNFEELASLYRMVGEVLEKQGRKELSLMAYQVSFLISPSGAFLEKIVASAPSPGYLKICLEEISEALEFHREGGKKAVMIEKLYSPLSSIRSPGPG